MDDTAEKVQEIINACVSHAMEKNLDAIAAAWMLGGATKIDFIDGEVVMTHIPPEEMYKLPGLPRPREA